PPGEGGRLHRQIVAVGTKRPQRGEIVPKPRTADLPEALFTDTLKGVDAEIREEDLALQRGFGKGMGRVAHQNLATVRGSADASRPVGRRTVITRASLLLADERFAGVHP